MEDENGDITFTVPETKIIDTMSFFEKRKDSEGLKYTLLSDDTYSVTGLGSCTDTDVVIPSTYNGKAVTSIGNKAFYMCKTLTSIIIPDSVMSVGSSAFYGCGGLTSVTIPDSVTSIGGEAFESCNGLTIVVIGNGLNSIGDRVFASCSALASVTIGEGVKSVSSYAFWRCHSLTNISVSENNAYYKSVDGNLYSKDGVTLVQYAIGKTMTSFVTPDGVTSIGDDAFYGCSNLVSVTIGDSVTSIGISAFSGCSGLTSIAIGSGMTSIDYMAFDGCGGLMNIYIGDMAVWCNISGLENIMTRGASNKNLYLNGVLVTELTIPDSVTCIGDYAFMGIGITSVVIGGGVTKISANAFLNCSKLASVYYKGMESEWNKIYVGYNSNLKNATRYYYSETQPTSTGNYWHYVDGVPTVW